MTYMNGWAGIETLENVLTPYAWGCPSDGWLRVSGNTDVLVTFNNNTSITAGDKQYVTCRELDLTCQ